MYLSALSSSTPLFFQTSSLQKAQSHLPFTRASARPQSRVLISRDPSRSSDNLCTQYDRRLAMLLLWRCQSHSECGCHMPGVFTPEVSRMPYGTTYPRRPYINIRIAFSVPSLTKCLRRCTAPQLPVYEYWLRFIKRRRKGHEWLLDNSPATEWLQLQLYL